MITSSRNDVKGRFSSIALATLSEILAFATSSSLVAILKNSRQFFCFRDSDFPVVRRSSTFKNVDKFKIELTSLSLSGVLSRSSEMSASGSSNSSSLERYVLFRLAFCVFLARSFKVEA